MRRWRRTTSTNCGSRLAAQTAAAWPIAQSSKPRYPQPQTEAEGRGESAVQDRHRTGRATHKDRLGERAMHGRLEARHALALGGMKLDHQISAPPPNEKNDRKKLDAAKAMDRPNTIWISRRKPPRRIAERKRQASDDDDDYREDLWQPVPSIDCRIWLSGCSHGMFAPAA